MAGACPARLPLTDGIVQKDFLGYQSACECIGAELVHWQGSFIMVRSLTGGMNRRTAIGAIAVASATTSILIHAKGPTDAAPAFKPENFGARGDGRTNDTTAFRRMAEAVNRAGGGRIVLRPTVYLVGEQEAGAPGSPYAFEPRTVLRLTGCEQSVSIEGNGATLRCAPGMRYGTFDRQTGQRIDLPMPNTRTGSLSSPYDYMVMIEQCRGAVTVADLELDGNVSTHRIGGPWGDTGWQITCDGLFLRDNMADEVVRNIYTHHHARDGMIIAGVSSPRPRTRRSFTGIRSERNGRQGCSLIGGRGYVFTDCRFSHTGRGPVSSAPGAGFDIESESAAIRNLRFNRCIFDNNSGCGMVADSGDSANVLFADCRFIGTTNWAIWPNKPGFRFDRCELVGACVRFFSSPDPAMATRFFDCVFTDAPARSNTRKVYINGPMANVSDSQNVLFARCRFSASHGAQLPWSTDAIFDSCTMRQSGTTQAFPRGLFRGTNRIDGTVDIGASRIHGSLLLNGQVVPPRL